jgi:hypothetical protein
MSRRIVYAIVNSEAYGAPPLAMYDNREAAEVHLNHLLVGSPHLRNVFEIEERRIRTMFDPDDTEWDG